MRLLYCCILAAIFSTTAPCIAEEWPPTELVGGWLVNSTSADGDPDVARGNLVLLISGERLILAESFPNNALLPYADALRVSEGRLRDKSYTALLHIPAVRPSCFSAGQKKTEEAVAFLIDHNNGNERLTIVLKDLTLRAKRLGHDDATNRLRSLLREPDLECHETLRKFLVDYVTQPAKPISDEP